MAKVLVTGGAGFIGSHLVEGLLADGNEVSILDDFSTGHEKNIATFRDSITVHEADLRDRDSVRAAVAEKDYVFHQAALASVPRSVDDPLSTNDVNVNGTLHVLEAARDAGVRRVIYAASSSAYGDSEISPKHEQLLPGPLSPYAVSKLVGEHYCRAFSQVYGLETLSIRYFNVFGPRQDPNSPYSAVIPLFVSALLRGEAPTIEGDGLQTRDFTFVANVVSGNMKAMAAERTNGESVNVACGGSYSVLDLCRGIARHLGTEIEPRHIARRVGDVDHSLADIALAGKLLGYDPVVSFEDGLKATVEWYQAENRAAGE